MIEYYMYLPSLPLPIFDWVEQSTQLFFQGSIVGNPYWVPAFTLVSKYNHYIYSSTGNLPPKESFIVIIMSIHLLKISVHAHVKDLYFLSFSN